MPWKTSSTALCAWTTGQWSKEGAGECVWLTFVLIKSLMVLMRGGRARWKVVVRAMYAIWAMRRA